MRYWVKIKGESRGPMEAAELAMIPSVSPTTMLCPEGRDPLNRMNWDFLRSFPEAGEALRARPSRSEVLEELTAIGAVREERKRNTPAPATGKRPAAASSGRSLGYKLFGAALVAASAASWRPRPQAPPTPPRPPQPPKSFVRQVLDFSLPACGATLGAAAGRVPPQISPVPGGGFRFSWGSAPSGAKAGVMTLDERTGKFVPTPSNEVSMTYDERKREFKALSPAARALFDVRKGCGRAG